MIDDQEPEPERRRIEGDPHERTLLASAQIDEPSSEIRAAILRTVLAAHRAEHRRRVGFRVALGGGVLAAAAALAVLYQQRKQPAVAMRPETHQRPAAQPSVPTASASADGLDALSPCVSPTIAGGGQPLIDDFEDGDSRVPMLEHRAGNWFAFNDGTGTQQQRNGATVTPTRLPDGTASNRFALSTSGSKFTKWGANLSFEFSPHRCYDASVYAGVEFLARGRGDLWVSIKMTQVVPDEFGGSCKHDCYDGHRKLIQLTPRFQSYRIGWDELQQAGYGEALPFDPHSLYSIEFAVQREQTPFTFWVDNLSFIRR